MVEGGASASSELPALEICSSPESKGCSFGWRLIIGWPNRLKGFGLLTGVFWPR